LTLVCARAYTPRVAPHEINVSLAQTPADFFGLVRLRAEVFVLEQRVPIAIELDEFDGAALHAVARAGGELIGTARLVIRGETGKIGRMAVRQSHRRRGAGRRLVEFLVALARRRGVERLTLHAQVQAVPFYQKMGFKASGAAFEEAGIPHLAMDRRL
jgi:ElaA protein